MKALKLAMFALLIATLSACGPQQYSPEDCNELVQKIEKKQTLTEDDFEDPLFGLRKIAINNIYSRVPSEICTISMA